MADQMKSVLPIFKGSFWTRHPVTDSVWKAPLRRTGGLFWQSIPILVAQILLMIVLSAPVSTTVRTGCPITSMSIVMRTPSILSSLHGEGEDLSLQVGNEFRPSFQLGVRTWPIALTRWLLVRMEMQRVSNYCPDNHGKSDRTCYKYYTCLGELDWVNVLAGDTD